MPRKSTAEDLRFHHVGQFLAGLRKGAYLDQAELAERAGISEDQVARVERGENTGIWYVMAIMSVLDPPTDAAPSLLENLKFDGKRVIASGELKKRIKTPRRKGRKEKKPSNRFLGTRSANHADRRHQAASSAL